VRQVRAVLFAYRVCNCKSFWQKSAVMVEVNKKFSIKSIIAYYADSSAESSSLKKAKNTAVFVQMLLCFGFLMV